jgi:catechol 2,3-dioxygenase-like lactoylglutathione lyase family enzyme
MQTSTRFGFAVEYVKDIDAARRFYVDVLGLKVERAAPTFIQFEHFGITSEQQMSAGSQPELYWLVDDAEAAFREMSNQAPVGLELTDLPFGRLFTVKDPDGMPCFVLQLAAQRPSAAV